ncbi:MAG: GAF domain-containing sensor histidine kinase [Bacteroidota bacterium]
MLKPPIPKNERERIEALEEFHILDTLPERDFDDITKIASEICGTPISLISLIDVGRQWFKSKQGIDVNETSRDLAFCAHAINKPNEIMIVPDSSKDERFFDNPLVVQEPHVVFYAGVPLVTSDGLAVGTLCVIDHIPKKLNPQQQNTLRALANQVVCQLELRKKIRLLHESQGVLKDAYNSMERFAYVASHDLRSPLNNIVSLTNLLKAHYANKLDAEGNEYIDYLNDSAFKLTALVDGILEYSKSSQLSSMKKEDVDIHILIKEIISLLNPPKSISFEYPEYTSIVHTSAIALKQILLNLCANAIKYNDKEQGVIKIDFSQTKDLYTFIISDNGPGIPIAQHQKVFELFQTLKERDRFDKRGIGIGLSTVKKLVERLGGRIEIESEPGRGTAFEFTIKK